MAISASNCTGPPLNTTAGGAERSIHRSRPSITALVGGLVEHHTDGALAAVFHHVDDRPVEIRVIEGWRRQQQHAPRCRIDGIHSAILALRTTDRFAPELARRTSLEMFKKFLGGVALVVGLVVAGVVGFQLLDSPFTTVTKDHSPPRSCSNCAISRISMLRRLNSR